MPLTPIGKVARAELRMRAAEQVFRELLTQAGITASVRVKPDLQRGTVAFVECVAVEEARVQDLFGRFPFPLDFSRPA
jgi:fatty-acyl-CoA synthase